MELHIIFGQMKAVLFNPTIANLKAAPLLIVLAKKVADLYAKELFGAIPDDADDEFYDACGIMAEVHECIEDFEDKINYLSNLN